MITLPLFNRIKSALQPFAKPKTDPAVEDLTAARAEYAEAKAIWDARNDAGDTRGMGQAWPRLAAANQWVHRAERAALAGRKAG